jgi:hypothetical protein
VTVGYVKRYLEAETDRVLDSVRLYGSAVLSERHRGQQPYALLQQTLQILATDWLTAPSREQSHRLAELEAAVAEWQCGAPQDLLWDWREALEDCVEEAVECVEEWLSPYGLRLEWSTAGLLAVPERGEEL